MSFTIKANLVAWSLVAVIVVGFSLAGSEDRGFLGIALVPVWLACLACGLPWTALDFDALNRMSASASIWSSTNLLYEIIVIRGIFINATLMGLVIDARRWSQYRKQWDSTLGELVRENPAQAMAMLIVLLIVCTMIVLPLALHSSSSA